jgi:hypothetical protein
MHIVCVCCRAIYCLLRLSDVSRRLATTLIEVPVRRGRRSQTEPRRLNVSAYYTAEARVNYIALSMDHVRFRNALLRDLSPFAFARRATSVGNDPYRGACTRRATALGAK